MLEKRLGGGEREVRRRRGARRSNAPDSLASSAAAEPTAVPLAAPAAEPARLGAVAVPLYGGPDEAFSYRGDTRFPAASTIKTYVLQAVLEAVAAGRVSLGDEIELRATDQVGGSGVLRSLTPGRRYTVLDLATLMVVVSDNTATNLLIEQVGVEELNASIRRHGFTGTLALGKLALNRPPPATGPSLSHTTPADLASYFGKLWRDELLPPELGDVARAIYRQQQYSYLGRELDYDRYAAANGEGPFRIASKTGSIRGVRNDAGIFEPLAPGGRPLIVAVMSSGCPDTRYSHDNLGERVVAAAGKALYAAMR